MAVAKFCFAIHKETCSIIAAHCHGIATNWVKRCPLSSNVSKNKHLHNVSLNISEKCDASIWRVTNRFRQLQHPPEPLCSLEMLEQSYQIIWSNNPSNNPDNHLSNSHYENLITYRAVCTSTAKTEEYSECFQLEQLIQDRTQFLICNETVSYTT